MAKKATTNTGLYTVDEAANYLRISVRTMRELIFLGEITYRRTGGKKKGLIVFKLEDLEKRLEPAGGPGVKNQTGGAQ